MPRRPVLLAVALAVLGFPAAAGAQTAGSSAATIDPNILTVPAREEVPPDGWRYSGVEAVKIAHAHPKIAGARREHRRTTTKAFLKGDRRWQVSVYVPRPGADREVAQAFVDDRTGEVQEAWTGIQVPWTMARGYPGSFGRRANAPYVWLPLLALFLLPFLRPPWRMLHVDLAAMAALSIGYAFFSAGKIAESAVAASVVLAYLAVRMLLLARARGREGGLDPKPPLPLLVGPGFLGVALVFLLGFRLGLNVTDSNPIDVGYAGVIGADRISDWEPLYGDFPNDNQRGDTYGPLNYLVYVPFEKVFPWKGTWDDLPAAHAVTILFDLLCMALLWLVGRRLRGPRLAALLPYMWATYPFTMVVSNSNANDGIVAALLLVAVLAAASPVGRGAAVGAAGMAKFAPLIVGPLFATYRGGTVRAAAAMAAVIAALLAFVAVLDGGLGGFWERTLEFQLGRESPFSPWGYWGLEWPQRIIQGLTVVAAIAVAFVPRRRDAASLAALAAALLLLLQLGVSHWFYLYVVWFAPLVWIALLAPHEDPPPPA